MPRESPLLTAREAAAWLRFERPDGQPDLNRLYLARSRHGLRACKAGGLLRFRVRDLDAFLEHESAPATAGPARVVTLAGWQQGERHGRRASRR